MNTASKEQMLNTLENRVELHIQEAIRVFQNLDHSILLTHAPDGGWSIAQCLAHLNSYGNYYLPLIREGLNKQQDKSSDNTFSSSWIGRYFTSIMEPGTGRKKYKAFKSHIPDIELNAHAVVGEFIGQQEALLICLKKAKDADLHNITIPVSILKWVRLHLMDVFQFIIAHNERHIVQARRNLV